MLSRTSSVWISTAPKSRCATASPAHKAATLSIAPSAAIGNSVACDLIRAVLRSLRRLRRQQLLQPLAVLRVHRPRAAHRGLERNAVLLRELVQERVLARQVVREVIRRQHDLDAALARIRADSIRLAEHVVPRPEERLLEVDRILNVDGPREMVAVPDEMLRDDGAIAARNAVP